MATDTRTWHVSDYVNAYEKQRECIAKLVDALSRYSTRDKCIGDSLSTGSIVCDFAHECPRDCDFHTAKAALAKAEELLK